MELDLSSLASVRVFVAEFKASKLGLDSLILNAGVMHSVSVFVDKLPRVVFCPCLISLFHWSVLASLFLDAGSKSKQKPDLNDQGKTLKEYTLAPPPPNPSCGTHRGAR